MSLPEAWAMWVFDPRMPALGDRFFGLFPSFELCDITARLVTAALPLIARCHHLPAELAL